MSVSNYLKKNLSHFIDNGLTIIDFCNVSRPTSSNGQKDNSTREYIATMAGSNIYTLINFRLSVFNF